MLEINAKKVVVVDGDFLAENFGADGYQRLGMSADDVVGNKSTIAL